MLARLKTHTLLLFRFFFLKQGTQPRMGRHSQVALVTEATAVVINNGALYGSKFNLGCPYRDMTNLRGEEQQTC